MKLHRSLFKTFLFIGALMGITNIFAAQDHAQPFHRIILQHPSWGNETSYLDFNIEEALATPGMFERLFLVTHLVFPAAMEEWEAAGIPTIPNRVANILHIGLTRLGDRTIPEELSEQFNNFVRGHVALYYRNRHDSQIAG